MKQRDDATALSFTKHDLQSESPAVSRPTYFTRQIPPLRNSLCYRQQTAEPILRALLEEISRQISSHRGELAAIVQFVYSLAATRLQPFLRGALARRRLPDAHWEMLSYVSVTSSACGTTPSLRSRVASLKTRHYEDEGDTTSRFADYRQQRSRAPPPPPRSFAGVCTVEFRNNEASGWSHRLL